MNKLRYCKIENIKNGWEATWLISLSLAVDDIFNAVDAIIGNQACQNGHCYFLFSLRRMTGGGGGGGLQRTSQYPV